MASDRTWYRSVLVAHVRDRRWVPSNFSHRAYRADLRRNLRLSKMPTRDQFLTEAREMFTRTISLDDIIDRAYELLLESVGSLLVVQAQ
jgi:hypothetical protein